MRDTVKITAIVRTRRVYSGIRGVIDTGISRSKWSRMPKHRQDKIIDELVDEFVHRNVDVELSIW